MSDPYNAAIAVAVGATKPQRPGYGPGFVPPPYPGAPPIPAGVAVNPQQWQNGWWQYNPAYRPGGQHHMPWLAAQSWQQHMQQPSSSASAAAAQNPYHNPTSTSTSRAPYQNSTSAAAAAAANPFHNPQSLAAAAHAEANAQVRAAHARQAAQAAASFNPYKKEIPVPSEEYLRQPLISNPLGLWEVSKGEKNSMVAATPWIWNPAKLHVDKDEDDTDPEPDDPADDDDIMSSTTVVQSPDHKGQDYTAKVELKPTFSPSIVRTPSYYQQHTSPNSKGGLQRTATMPAPLGSLTNSSMNSLSSSASSSFSSMASFSSASSPMSARGTSNKPSPPRILDGDHLSEEPDSMLSPLPLFDKAPLPSFSNPFPADERHRDRDRHRNAPPRPSGLGRTSYTPPDAPEHGTSYDDTYRPESYDEHEHMTSSTSSPSGSSRRREDRGERDRDRDRERKMAKDLAKREKREADRKLKTERGADRALKVTLNSPHHSGQPLPASSHSPPSPPPIDSQRSGGSGSTRSTPTPTPNQQQAAQYAQAKEQQERRSQEYVYYRSLERSRSGEGNDHESADRQQRQGSGGGGNSLRAAPTLEAIAEPSSSARHGSGEGESMGRWADWKGEQRGPPPSSSASAAAAAATGTSAPKPFPPPQPLPRRGSVMSSTMPNISSSSTPPRIVDRRESVRELSADALTMHKLGLGSKHTVASYAPSPAPRRQESPLAHRGMESRDSSHDMTPHRSTRDPRDPANYERRDSARDSQRKDLGDTPVRARPAPVAVPFNYANVPQPWQETPVRTPDRGGASRRGSDNTGRARGASFASPSPSPSDPAFAHSTRRDSGKDRDGDRSQSMSSVDGGGSNTTTPTPSRFASSQKSHDTRSSQRSYDQPAPSANPLPRPPMASPLAENITSMASLDRFQQMLSPPSTPAHALPHSRRRTKSPSRSRSRSRSRDRFSRSGYFNIHSPPPASGHDPAGLLSPSGPQPHPPLHLMGRSSTPRTSSSTSTTTPPTVVGAASGSHPRRPPSTSNNALDRRSSSSPQSLSPSSSSFDIPLGVGPGPWRRRVGFWNRRGDHITSDGHIVFAPPDRAYPQDLRQYPTEQEGYMDQFGQKLEWKSRPELPDSLPRHGQPPVKPYDGFIIHVDVSSTGTTS